MFKMIAGKRCIRRLEALIAILLLAAGCSAEEHTSGEDTAAGGEKPPVSIGRAGSTFVYECDDGSQITVRVEGNTAWLFLRSGTVSVPQVPAASGAKYSDGKNTYWSHGEEGSIEPAGQAALKCRNNRAKAIWEDAKLRGADFRATGNEPGWYLEISRDYGIVFVTNYGAERYHFEAFDAASDRESATTAYEASKDEHQLRIVLEAKRCTDTMSGAQFATTVTVTLDGTTLNGCGQALH